LAIVGNPWTNAVNRPSDALYVLAAIAAFVGLFARSEQRPPDCFVLGVWLLALPSFIGGLLSLSAYADEQTGKLPLASDLLGIVAAVLLLASLARRTDRSVRPSRTSLSTWICLSVVAGAGLYLGRLISIDSQMSLLAPAGVSIILTILVLVNALRLRSRVMGGGVLLGWIAALVLGRVTGSPVYIWHRSLFGLASQRQGFGYSPVYIYAVLFLLLGAVLALAYAMRKDRTSVE
jgi:membrane-associated HD superfamily phosphohydrolase